MVMKTSAHLQREGVLRNGGRNGVGIKSETGQGHAAEHQGQSERKDQSHQDGISFFAADHPVNQGLNQVSDQTENQKNCRQENKRIHDGPQVEIISQKSPQHDPFADGKINDVHDAVGQGKPDGNGDINSADQNAVNRGLRQ